MIFKRKYRPETQKYIKFTCSYIRPEDLHRQPVTKDYAIPNGYDYSPQRNTDFSDPFGDISFDVVFPDPLQPYLAEMDEIYRETERLFFQPIVPPGAHVLNYDVRLEERVIRDGHLHYRRRTSPKYNNR